MTIRSIRKVNGQRRSAWVSERDVSRLTGVVRYSNTPDHPQSFDPISHDLSGYFVAAKLLLLVCFVLVSVTKQMMYGCQVVLCLAIFLVLQDLNSTFHR